MMVITQILEQGKKVKIVCSTKIRLDMQYENLPLEQIFLEIFLLCSVTIPFQKEYL